MLKSSKNTIQTYQLYWSLFSDSGCSFTSVGLNTIGDCGDDNFDQLVGSFEHCTESCIVNPLCRGVSYTTSRSICRRYTCDISTTSRADGNVEFFPLTCTGMFFILHFENLLRTKNELNIFAHKKLTEYFCKQIFLL